MKNNHMVRTGLFALSLFGGVLVGGVSFISFTQPVASASCQFAAIPAYFYPSSWSPSTDFWRIGSSDTATAGRIFVMNPASGPGTAAISDYTTDIIYVRAKGALVYGYVPTTYGARAAATVKADIDKYFAWYPVDGIFFDEVPTSAANVAYYQDLALYVRAKAATAGIILNPGITPDEAYVRDVATGPRDIVITFESDVNSYINATFPAWTKNYPASKFEHLVYGVSAAQLSQIVALTQSRNAGVAYITNDTLPNPWDTLPPYWSTEAAALAATCGSVTPPPPPPPVATKPVITSFTAAPTTIKRGITTKLSWDIMGATKITIDEIGTVTGTSTTVSPRQTTTYTITAKNTKGSVSKSVKVTVTR